MRQIDALKSPRFTQVSTFGRLPLCQKLNDGEAVFIGIPFNDATSYRPGARFGPAGIRQGSRLLRPYNQFMDVYPFDSLNVCDMGDINIIPGYIEDTMKVIEEELLKIDAIPFIAGGDHSITLPILRAMYKKHGKINLIHLDSHYDFWDSYWGKKYTHGTWLRRALEEGILNEVVQMGIRGSVYSKDDVEDSKKLGVKSFTIRDLKYRLKEVLKELPSGKTYVSVDIDVVDPAFAPGTGTPEVGGLTSFEVIEIIRSFNFNIIGFDVVEISPPYDVSELTSMLGANIIFEGLSVLAKRR
ncbi:agmatinase [Stygiolobus caldivivus]|uniref:Agmatinase n=1 Tax=Stygiolobus caldivivus TaxID=2824673 RepID=A0A8D5ZKU1_9CREN|nr:agmatinase [Stygiolobus caldivivus]BCU71627.1 agmatinase [Stygiolobus caldivivus]